MKTVHWRLSQLRRDHRVTHLGAFLRKTSLDELPQNPNVLEGTMNFVGPSPHAVAHNEKYMISGSSQIGRHDDIATIRAEATGEYIATHLGNRQYAG